MFSKCKKLLIGRLLNIEIWYIKIYSARPPQPPEITGNFKPYL